MKSKQLFARIAFTFMLLTSGSIQLSCNDAKSNTIFKQMPLAAIIKASKINTNSIYFFVDKSDYRLTVMADTIELKSYNVVFGGNPKDDKIQQGDGCTPEGWFKIKAMYPHKKWSKFMWIDYPNAQSKTKFNQAVENKTISADTDIGGDIGIHGVPKGADEMIAKKFNWTLGCISLTNADVNEIYAVVKVGTKVFIQK